MQLWCQTIHEFWDPVEQIRRHANNTLSKPRRKIKGKKYENTKNMQQIIFLLLTLRTSKSIKIIESYFMPSVHNMQILFILHPVRK